MRRLKSFTRPRVPEADLHAWQDWLCLPLERSPNAADRLTEKCETVLAWT